MSSRSPREMRQLRTRKDGLMRKAVDLRRLCGGVRIAIIIEYDGTVDSFRTEDGFPSSLNIQNANELRPEDYMTAREAQVQEEFERERQSTSSELELLEDDLFLPETCPDLESIYKAGTSPPFAEQESISAETPPQALINDVDGGLLGLQWDNIAPDRIEQSRRWQLAGMPRHNDTKYGNGKTNNLGRIQKVQMRTDQSPKRRMIARQQAMSGGRDC